MLNTKKISAKELFESIKIERLKSEHRAEEYKILKANHLKELEGENAEEKHE